MEADLGGTLLSNLCKSFGCIKHDLLLAKLAVHGFDSHSLSFVFTYLIERNKEHKYIIPTRPYAHTTCAVLQGSI